MAQVSFSFYLSQTELETYRGAIVFSVWQARVHLSQARKGEGQGAQHSQSYPCKQKKKFCYNFLKGEGELD